MRISDWSSDVCSSDLVVARALLRGAGPVGHLVPVQARRLKEVVGHFVHVGFASVVGIGELATADLARELGAVLDGQRVCGEGVGNQSHRLHKRAATYEERRAWQERGSKLRSWWTE